MLYFANSNSCKGLPWTCKSAKKPPALSNSPKRTYQSYAEITGDYNPLHFDGGFAGKTKFKELVVQGGLTSGILDVLVAMDMLDQAPFS